MQKSAPKQSAPRVLAVGIGSPHGDDQIGWIVIRELTKAVGGNVLTRTAHSPADLLDWLEEIDELVVCDACLSDSVVGTLHRWTWPTDSLAINGCSGSHDLTLPFVLALAERLGQLPARVTVWGIELGDFSPGSRLGDVVRDAVPQMVQIIASDLSTAHSRPEACRHA